MLSSSIGLARAQITDVQNDGGFFFGSRCLIGYYRHDNGKITTTIQSKTNEKKNNVLFCRFLVSGNPSHVVSSANLKSQALWWCHQNHAWQFFFLQHGILVSMDVFCCKHNLLNCLNSYIFNHYIISLVVSLMKIWVLTRFHVYWYVARDISINKSKRTCKIIHALGTYRFVQC